jgi:hypothetical protein
MSFASRFNLTAGIIPVVTFGRAKQPPARCVEDIFSDSGRRLVLEQI